MTKKTTSTTPTSDYIKDSSREYSVYVCENRAIPKVADGMKDGPRKAMWLMKTRADKIKTVSLAGEMISSGLYLHGDKSAADSISMLAAPYVNNVPMLEGIGSFGTRVAPVEGIGAPRYTYVKKNRASDMLLFQDLDIVPLKDNYDGSNKEPMHFLPLIPMVLLNGTSGIAVGWSTDILPRNLKKLVAATQQVLEGKEPKGLEPSFDYLNVQVKNLEPNVWQFSGRCEIIDTSSCRITELPPGLNLEGMKKRLNKLEEDGKIQTYTDKSTATINIIVKFKRGEIKDWAEEDAIAFFKLREKSTERIVVVDWNGSSIRQYESAAQVVKEFVSWRLGWYSKRYQKMLDDDGYELKYWQGIKACFDDKLPERLGKKANKDAVVLEVDTITASIGLDATQIDRIVSLPTYRWAKDFLATVKENISRLQANIKEYKTILKSPDLIKDIYAAELEELKKVK
jgi:DNA gyrase/topoisomerase IV subunit A